MEISRISTPEQTTYLKMANIRFVEDTPVAIPRLQEAIKICSDNPYILQVLIYFFTKLLSVHRNYLVTDNQQITDQWDISCRDLLNPYGHIYHDTYTMQALYFIKQLDPIATYRELTDEALVHLRGHPEDGEYITPVGYTIINRGHDWIVRCALECNVPDRVKHWLELMYPFQPWKIVDMSSRLVGENVDVLFAYLDDAGNRGGPDAMMHVLRLWLRQAMTVVDIWKYCPVEQREDSSLMPRYDWCVSAYRKMFYQFQKELQNPFSEYPYAERDGLKDVSFMRIFEHCWLLAALESQYMGLVVVDREILRCQVHGHVLSIVQNMFRDRIQDIDHHLDKAFGSLELVREEPLIDLRSLEDELRPWHCLMDRLGQQFYGHNLPDMMFEGMEAYENDFEVVYDSEDEADLDMEDIEVEAHGEWIDITELTVDQQPQTDDLCTVCQDGISPDDSYDRRCVALLNCLHVFHAECFAHWVNGTAKNSNLCPDCRAQATSRKRPVRPKL
jgi:hypothetical protein